MSKGIKLQIDVTDITPEQFKSMSTGKITSSDVKLCLSSNPALIDVLVSRELSDDEFRAFEGVNDLHTALSTAQIDSIVKNNNSLPGTINYGMGVSAELLMKYANKFDMYFIEIAENLTPEFVEKYFHQMDISAFIRSRKNMYSDFDKFLKSDIIFEKLVHHECSWYRNTEQSTEGLSRLFSGSELSGIFSGSAIKNELSKILDTITCADLLAFRPESKMYIELLAKHYSDKSTFTYAELLCAIDKISWGKLSILFDDYFSQVLLPKISTSLITLKNTVVMK